MKDDRALASTAGDCAMGGEGALRDTAAVNAQADELPRPRGVYVDAAVWHWQGLKWAHLLADDIDELHRFAARLGIHRASYQGPPRWPAAAKRSSPSYAARAGLGASATPLPRDREEDDSVSLSLNRRCVGWVERSENMMGCVSLDPSYGCKD